MGKLIETIQKNTMEEVRVSLTEYLGHELCDLRIYFQPDGCGEFKPTKKGITVKTDLIADLIKALQKADDEIKKGVRVDLEF